MHFFTTFLSLMFVVTQFCFSQNALTIHRYLWANYSNFSGKNDQAYEWYKQIFLSNNSPYTYKGYLNFLFNTKQYETIVTLMPHLTKKFINDIEIQLIFVYALEQSNKCKEAENLIISLSQSFKTNPDVALRAAQIYFRRNEAKNALLTIESLLNNTPQRRHNFVFYFLKSQIHIQLNQLHEALEDINRCLELHPQFDKGWLLQASLYERKGKIKEALTGYATFLELSGGNGEIERRLFVLTLKQKAIEDNKKILLSHSISIENALILFNQQRYDQALAHIDKCIELNESDVECKLLKLQILSAMKDFQSALQSASLWITQDAQSEVWPKALFLLSCNNISHKEAIEIFEKLLAANPNNLWLNLYCADLYMRKFDTDNAINYLNKALLLINNEELRCTVLYHLALLYYQQENYSAMYSHLNTANALDQKSGHINNALAYYWATKGKDILKARTFVEKALAVDGSNSYFLDTLALILYKEKKYEQAQQILEHILVQNEYQNNGMMILHLAKIYYTLNNKETAELWTKKAESAIKNNIEKKALTKMHLLLANQ